MSGPERLYGLDGDEYLQTDPDEVLERWLEDHDPADLEPGDMVTLPVILEWDTYPPRHHFPKVDRLLEWIVEWAAENGEVDEGWHDEHEAAAKDPGAMAVADALLDRLAERVRYRMARTELRRLEVTLDASGEWLIDGHPTGRRLIETADPSPAASAAADRIRRVFVTDDGTVNREAHA